jgi:hypothetical protein
LHKITTLHDNFFTEAGFDIVICGSKSQFTNWTKRLIVVHLRPHFPLENRVEHGDSSLSNMMYDSDLKCGVLTDFDLSITQWEERIGTIAAFMVLDLSYDRCWKGLVQQRHHHKLESFAYADQVGQRKRNM